jgi:hypothetical protein
MEVRMKAVALAGLAVIVLSAAAPSAQPSNPTTPSIEKPFAPGGRIQLKLHAADYKITGRSDGKIRVMWRSDRPDALAGVRADINVTGRTAVITTSGVKNSVSFTIDVPSRTDIEIDLTAGDLEVRGIEGSKRIESWAGDVSIDVGQPGQYRQVDASVRAGDISALPFKVSTGGLLRSFRWTGQGPYTLAVKLFAGDLTLR